MSTTVHGDHAAGSGTSGSGGGATGRRRAPGVRALIALVACSAAIFWAWRVWWDQGHPLQAAARGLGAGDPSRRTEAIRDVSELGYRRPGESIRLLIPVVKDRDAGVRAAAITSLGLLSSNAMGVGVDAADARAASEALLGLAEDPDGRVRAALTTSLAVIGSAGSAGRPAGRNASAAKKGTTPVIDVDAVAARLTAALDSPEEPVRQAALVGLGTMAARLPGGPSPSLIKAVDDASVGNRQAAAVALGHYRQGLDPAIPRLLGHLEDEQPEVRQACAEAFRRIRPPAVSPAVAPAVIAALRTPDRSARSSLVALLGQLKPDPGAAVPALIPVLREPIDSDVKAVERSTVTYDTYNGPAHEAAKALGAIAPGTPQAGEAMAALVDVVRSGPAQRKGSAAEALGAFGPAAISAVPPLVGMLKETATAQAPTRAGGSAAGALGKIAPGTPAADEALAALTAALRAPWIPTREAGLEALPAFGPKAAAALPAIRELKDKDPDPGVRKAAGSALEKIKA
jgi:HEAT repeat protein